MQPFQDVIFLTTETTMMIRMILSLSGSGALTVRNADTVTVVHCNFSNNEGGIELYDSDSYTVNKIRSLSIKSSTFINT